MIKEGHRNIALPVILHHLGLTKFAKEILVMCDDDQLEVGMTLPLLDDAPRKSASIVQEAVIITYSTRLSASASIFSTSRALVGSSSARMPQF